MDDKARAARAALDRIEGRGKTTRIPGDVRECVVEYVKFARAKRVRWSAISAELGLSRTAMQRWLRADAMPTGRLRRVRVAKEATRHSLSLVAPSGHRIEGLTLEEAAGLLGLLT